jgi:hypothetical protein
MACKKIGLVLLAAVFCSGPSLAQEKLRITPELVAAAEAEGQFTLQYIRKHQIHFRRPR